MISQSSVHESSHAVVGHVCGTPATKLTLRPPFCFYSDGTSAMWRGTAVAMAPRTDAERWRVGLLRSVAGPIGESRFSGEAFDVVLRRAKSDFGMAMANAGGLGGDAVLRVLVGEARDLIEQNWDVVLKLARCLEISRSLNEVEIARIIHRVQARGVIGG
jgi:hypothetical protein